MESDRESAIRFLADNLIERYPDLAAEIDAAASAYRSILHEGSMFLLRRLNGLNPDQDIANFLRLIDEQG